MSFFFYVSRDHRDLHVLTHSFPTRRSSALVAADPCALAIATPSAVLSGVARAARGRVLIKGGAPLELLGSLDAMAFDKTGALTSGEPRIREKIGRANV